MGTSASVFEGPDYKFFFVKILPKENTNISLLSFEEFKSTTISDISKIV